MDYEHEVDMDMGSFFLFSMTLVDVVLYLLCVIMIGLYGFRHYRMSVLVTVLLACESSDTPVVDASRTKLHFYWFNTSPTTLDKSLELYSPRVRIRMTYGLLSLAPVLNGI